MKNLKTFVKDLRFFLEKIDHYRDELLFLFIKPYWPRKITPNHITWVRTCIAVILFVLIFLFKIENKILIISLFSIGVASDVLDGSLARCLNQITEFGAMLDSTSDKILLLPIAVYSLIGAHKWLLIVLLFMEIFNAVASVHYKSKEIYLESNIFGKTKMALMCVVFIVILYMWPNSPSQAFIYLLWLTIPFTLLSFGSRLVEISKTRQTRSLKQFNQYETQPKDL